MEEVLKSSVYIETREGKKLVSSIAMTVLLVSFSMLFATLFLGYASYRLTSDVWPPLGMPRLDLFFPTQSTIFVLVSSFFFYLFEKAFEKKKVLSIRVSFFISIVFGLMFLVSQWLLWKQLVASGFIVDTGIFASIVYAFTGLHAAHIGAGIFALLFCLPALRKNVDIISYENRINNIGKFWHFLGIIWLVMYITIFVL